MLSRWFMFLKKLPKLPTSFHSRWKDAPAEKKKIINECARIGGLGGFIFPFALGSLFLVYASLATQFPSRHTLWESCVTIAGPAAIIGLLSKSATKTVLLNNWVHLLEMQTLRPNSAMALISTEVTARVFLRFCVLCAFFTPSAIFLTRIYDLRYGQTDMDISRRNQILIMDIDETKNAQLEVKSKTHSAVAREKEFEGFTTRRITEKLECDFPNLNSDTVLQILESKDYGARWEDIELSNDNFLQTILFRKAVLDIISKGTSKDEQNGLIFKELGSISKSLNILSTERIAPLEDFVLVDTNDMDVLLLQRFDQSLRRASLENKLSEIDTNIADYNDYHHFIRLPNRQSFKRQITQTVPIILLVGILSLVGGSPLLVGGAVYGLLVARPIVRKLAKATLP